MYYVYLMTNTNDSVIYCGVTNNLERRLYEHKEREDKHSFTAKYNIVKLVYFESHSQMKDAIAREKQIKGWIREKKNTLIETINPDWKDLSGGL